LSLFRRTDATPSILLKIGPAGEQLPKKIGQKVYGSSTDANCAGDETRDGESPPYRLVKGIVALSHADSWSEAKREWVLSHFFIAESPGVCLCGHCPIIEHCVIRNRENGNVAIVGNHCVRRFVGLPSERVFANLRRIAKERGAPLGEIAVEHAYAEGWLNDWERAFCLDTATQRRLSPRQRAKRKEINDRVLDRVTRRAGVDKGEGYA
jgi:hypothetical protein